MPKLPAMMFYPGDWLKDPAIRAVSLAARGLWIDMLCLMHESPRRGYLQHVSGKPVTAEQLARMTGCSTDEVSRLLQELEDAGVFSCTEHGVIYSRRMVRDEHIRQIRSEAGRKGVEQRLLKQNLSKTQAKAQAKRKQKSGISFSISSSSSISTTGESTSSEESKPSLDPLGCGKLKELECSELSCGEIGQADSPPSPAESLDQSGVPEDVARLTFPCDGPIKEWKITGTVYGTLKEAFQTIDIDAELRKAYAWLVANPGKRKTAKGMSRFLFNWMARCVDKNGPRINGNGSTRLPGLEDRNLAVARAFLDAKRQKGGPTL